MVRLDGIEPTTPAWKAEVLPLNYSRGTAPEACRDRMGIQAFVHNSDGVGVKWGLPTPEEVAYFDPTMATPATSGKPQSSVRAAQALAKQKALEKRAKTYKLDLAELSIFTSQLASLLQAGLPLVSCLEALQDQT